MNKFITSSIKSNRVKLYLHSDLAWLDFNSYNSNQCTKPPLRMSWRYVEGAHLSVKY